MCIGRFNVTVGGLEEIDTSISLSLKIEYCMHACVCCVLASTHANHRSLDTGYVAILHNFQCKAWSPRIWTHVIEQSPLHRIQLPMVWDVIAILHKKLTFVYVPMYV